MSREPSLIGGILSVYGGDKHLPEESETNLKPNSISPVTYLVCEVNS